MAHMPHVTGPRLTSQQAQETRNKKQDSRNRARKPWGRLQAQKPGRTTLNFLHHITFASSRNSGKMFPVCCESFWFSFGIPASRISALQFRPLGSCDRPLCNTYLLTYLHLWARYAILTYLHLWAHVACHMPQAQDTKILETGRVSPGAGSRPITVA